MIDNGTNLSSFLFTFGKTLIGIKILEEWSE